MLARFVSQAAQTVCVRSEHRGSFQAWGMGEYRCEVEPVLLWTRTRQACNVTGLRGLFRHNGRGKKIKADVNGDSSIIIVSPKYLFLCYSFSKD